MIILTLLVVKLCIGQDFTTIPYKQTNKFYNAEILPIAFIDYLKANNVKSIDLFINGKITKDFLVFNDSGQLISKNYFDRLKRDYLYSEKNLIKIIKPGKIFCMDNPDSIIFLYQDRQPTCGFAFQNSDTVGKVIFKYFKDSIIVKSYYPDYRSIKPIQTDTYFYEENRIIKETHTSHYENEYQIFYIYKGELLTNQIMNFYGQYKDQLITIKNGLIENSVYYFSDENFEKTIYKYNENDIEEITFNPKDEVIGYVKMILNKK